MDSNLTGGKKADLNGDGRPDVVTAGSRGSNGGRSAVWVLLTTNGLFPKIEDILATGPIGAVVDLNDDGAPDVLSGSPLGEFAVHFNAR